MTPIDIDLARRYMLFYLPADGQACVNDVWNFMKTNPMDLLQNALLNTQLSAIKSDTPGISAAAAQGVVTGFALAYCLSRDGFRDVLLKVVEDGERIKGEHVIDFTSRRKEFTGKKPCL